MQDLHTAIVGNFFFEFEEYSYGRDTLAVMVLKIYNIQIDLNEKAGRVH